MKYKKSKLRLNEMKGFYFLVWLLFIYERVIVKNPLWFNREKICSIYYMRFSFEKYAPYQI